MNPDELIHPLIRKAYSVLDGQPISRADALAIAEHVCGADLLDLISLANKVRLKFAPAVHSCSIVNAKSGKCRENCRFCAQSAAYGTGRSSRRKPCWKPPEKPTPRASARSAT